VIPGHSPRVPLGAVIDEYGPTWGEGGEQQGNMQKLRKEPFFQLQFVDHVSLARSPKPCVGNPCITDRARAKICFHDVKNKFMAA
jgi:hypothetical protein